MWPQSTTHPLVPLVARTILAATRDLTKLSLRSCHLIVAGMPPSAGVVLHALVGVARPPAGIDGLAVPRIRLCLDELRQSNAEHGQEGPTLHGVLGVGGD